MKRYIIGFLVVLVLIGCESKELNKSDALALPFDKNQNQSADYETSIQFYKNLANIYKKHVRVEKAGPSDHGKPIHKIIITEKHKASPQKTRQNNKLVVMINNAIHPGEPCGVDATMLFVRELLADRDRIKILKDVTFVIIPFYNIGGTLRRNSTSRTNQEGPEAYGFRGNAQNLDLNRDFIKSDSKNSKTFMDVFQDWKPDVFVDTHTSNGADYQYSITLLAAQHDMLPEPLSNFLRNKALPELFKKMETKKWEMTPYVYSYSTPDKGIMGFYDSPRYSMGYTNLFNCLSFTTETHMLKPFENRVLSTKAFLESLSELVVEEKSAIVKAKNESLEYLFATQEYGVDWENDFSRHDSILFKGYEAGYKPSKVTGEDRLYYDRDKPYSKKIPFYNYFKPKVVVDVPKAYLIPKSCWKVIDLLKRNKIEFELLEEDTMLEAEFYRVLDFETSETPYEGHHLHYDVKVQKEIRKQQFYEGDLKVSTKQNGFRYLLETLEPQAKDAFFAWNYFDSYLQRKEYYSAYVFEDEAARLLAESPDLKSKFEKKMEIDSSFAKSSRKQLFFIYENSNRNEGTVNLYPIARLH